MQDSTFEKIIQQIAKAGPLTSQELRSRMELALAEALRNPDPAVQAMWASVPKQGQQPTLEEFMEHLIRQNLLSPE